MLLYNLNTNGELSLIENFPFFVNEKKELCTHNVDLFESTEFVESGLNEVIPSFKELTDAPIMAYGQNLRGSNDS